MLDVKNIKRSKKTTILGAIFVLAGLATVLMGLSSWTESSVVIGAGVYLMFEKDPTKSDKNEKDKPCT